MGAWLAIASLTSTLGFSFIALVSDPSMPSGWTTEILRTDSPERFARAVQQAAVCLRTGQVVAVPTETVYGLAANAMNPAAVALLFEVKGRPAHNPIIVHVDSTAMARQCVAFWPQEAGLLASRFWPGPLTLVLPRSAMVPDLITAGGPTVGIRFPKHPFMSALIQACGFPLAAPSANLSGQVSPTSAEHVIRGLSGRIPLVIDAGATVVGIESTVVDLVADPPRILRPGMIDVGQLRQVLPRLDELGLVDRESLRSPGLLTQHYAPRAQLILLDWTSTHDLEQQLNAWCFPWQSVHVIAHTRVPDSSFPGRIVPAPNNAAGFARFLYAALHECDANGARLIVVERPPASPEWRGITDRLQRASTADHQG